MSPIKDFNLTYDALNEEITFSPGDTIVGTVTFNLTKDTKVKSFQIKVKGDANVKFSKGDNDYKDRRRYFEVKQYLVAEKAKGTVLPKGFHQFKFRLQIPRWDLPSSFNGNHGSITYMLEARISRSWSLDLKTQKEICFVSKTFPHMDEVMGPQSRSVTKEMGVFSKTQVHLSATASKKVCSPGDTLSFVAKIVNSSSKNVKPKFKFVQKIEYRADSHKYSKEKTLTKEVGNIISPSSEKTITCLLNIPRNVIHSIHNCEIISVEYYMKAYVDISFASDPEVVFPLVVVPSTLVDGTHLGEVAGPNPDPPGAVGAQSYSDFPPSNFPDGLHPLPAGSSADAYPPPYPPQPANIGSGYNNQWPQNLAPYGFSAEAPTPSLVQPPAITVPPQFEQDEEPPSYMTLYPPPYDALGSGSDHNV